MSKRLTLNNEKRKNIENVFKSYWEKNNIYPKNEPKLTQKRYKRSFTTS